MDPSTTVLTLNTGVEADAAYAGGRKQHSAATPIAAALRSGFTLGINYAVTVKVTVAL